MSLVTSEKDNGMGIITFNNPPKGFLTSKMIAETIPMIEDLDNDDSIKTFTTKAKKEFNNNDKCSM